MPGLVDVPGRSNPFPRETGGGVSNWREEESEATDRVYYMKEE